MSVDMERPSGRRRLSATARRARIVESALDAFASGGYGATGMGEIAELAGVTRAVLYDHFPSKRALFLAVLTEQNATFLGHIGAHITTEASAEVRMRATTDAVFSFAERFPNAWRMLFVNATHGDPEIDSAWNETAQARHHAVVILLAADLRDAGIDPESGSAGVVVEMLVGALIGAVEWRRKHRGVSRADLVEAGMGLLWTGLGHLRVRD